MSTGDLTAALDHKPSAVWINRTENRKFDPGYNKVKKIADYFENLQKKKEKTADQKNYTV